MIMLVALSVSTVSAQSKFAKGGKTISANVTGLDLGFNKTTDGGGFDDYINFDLSAKGSYFVIDNLAVSAGLGFGYGKWGKDNGDTNTNAFNFEVGGRYYFWNYLFGGLAYQGYKVKDIDYASYGRVDVGASLYISERVFFEPSIYFRQGFGDADINSKIGLSVGIGVNF